MQIDYGFAQITKGDQVYSLTPSLINVQKIGTPKEIVDCFQILQFRYAHYILSFRTAAKILQCCGIPEKLTGKTVFNERTNKSIISMGDIHPTEVFILAEHCLLHGVVGFIEDDDEDKEKVGEPLTEFDTHQYIISAVDNLGLSLTEANNITMTQYVRLVKAKNKNILSQQKSSNYDNIKTEDIPDDVRKEQENDAMALYYEKLEAINKANELKES